MLGAGGVLGHAWHSGALAGLARVTGWDPRTAEVVCGTSAGSVVGALLRAGIPAGDLAAQQTGDRLSAEGARIAAGMARPGGFPGERSLPGLALVPPRVLLGAMTGRVRIGALLASAVSEGRVSAQSIATLVDSVLPAWPAKALWACSVDAGTGRLHVVGRRRPEPCSPGTAVAASCAIPGFFRAVEIAGRPHLDGGAHSVTNADALLRTHIDVAVVLAPMIGVRFALPGPITAALNLAMARRLAGERDRLERRGIRTVVLAPSPADVEAMGSNLMNPARRAATARSAGDSVGASPEAEVVGSLLAS